MNTDESNAEAIINKDAHPRLSAVSLALAFEMHPEISGESRAD